MPSDTQNKDSNNRKMLNIDPDNQPGRFKEQIILSKYADDCCYQGSKQCRYDSSRATLNNPTQA